MYSYAVFAWKAVTLYQGEPGANFHDGLKTTRMKPDYTSCVMREKYFLAEFYVTSWH